MHDFIEMESNNLSKNREIIGKRVFLSEEACRVCRKNVFPPTFLFIATLTSHR